MLGHFVKNVSILVTGAIFSQIITILAAPLLSRLYTPEQFGEYGVFITIVGLLSTIAALTYDMSIVKQTKRTQANHLFQICIIIALSTSSVCFLLLLIFHSFIEMSFIYVLPIAMFLYAVNNAIYSLLNRYQLYNLLSKIQVLRSLMIVTLQIIFGYLSFTHYGLVVAVLISALIVGVYGYSQFIANYKIERFPGIKASKILLTTNLDFARFGLPQNVMSYLAANSPVLIFTLYYDLATVGAYFFAIKLVQVPANVMGASIKRVFYRQAEILSSDPIALSELYKKMTLIMTAMIIPIAVVWFVYAEEIFPAIFGEEWIVAAEFSKWMLIWFGAQFVMAPTRSLFIVFDIQKYLLIFDTGLGLFKILVLLLLVSSFNSGVVVMIYSLISALISILFVIGWSFYLARLRSLVEPS